MKEPKSTVRAFPLVVDDSYCAGMFLRDYFAAKALPALISTSIYPTGYADMKATQAYYMADAMLEARKK